MEHLCNYNRYPATKISKHQGCCMNGYDEIIYRLQADIKGDFVLTVDTYPGVDDEEIIEELRRLNPVYFINMKEIFKTEKELDLQLAEYLTSDRVFGRMCYGDIRDLLHTSKIEEARTHLEEKSGLKIIYGFGASLIHTGDLLIYLDLSRWEIQLRYRNGMGNYNCSNFGDDILTKYKRGFFVEWRIADKHKKTIMDQADYWIDTHIPGQPKMVEGQALREGLKQIAAQPFRTVPYFDPGVWGGQWMKEVCGLSQEKDNYAWSFDGVPEENSLYLDYGNGIVEIPAMDLVLYQPVLLLGEKVFARFGAEFPIRFDLLDTMEGQNLSLQVHPSTEYIKKQFGMTYTQDESYYILDAKEDGVVYLGLKDGIDKDNMINDLKVANMGGAEFSAKDYINCFPAKKHDHFLIPAGTCHCSGKNTMVLEISATPYIFTFKLWDWSRLGLDGKPRPIHLEHGANVIEWDRTTRWVNHNLVNAVHQTEQAAGYWVEQTGLHELEFIETKRYWITDKVLISTEGSVNVLNLVEGEQAVIESVDGAFEPYEVHYAETFIIPEQVGKFIISACAGKCIGVIRAYVRL